MAMKLARTCIHFLSEAHTGFIKYFLLVQYLQKLCTSMVSELLSFMLFINIYSRLSYGFCHQTWVEITSGPCDSTAF